MIGGYQIFARRTRLGWHVSFTMVAPSPMPSPMTIEVDDWVPRFLELLGDAQTASATGGLLMPILALRLQI